MSKFLCVEQSVNKKLLGSPKLGARACLIKITFASIASIACASVLSLAFAFLAPNYVTNVTNVISRVINSARMVYLQIYINFTDIRTSVNPQSSGISPLSKSCCLIRLNSLITRSPTFAAWPWAASLSFACRPRLILASETRCGPPDS